MTWKEYEAEVYLAIKRDYPNASSIEFNSKVLGKYSHGMRQCDAVITEHFSGLPFVTLVDAKHYATKLDVKDVEEFLSMASDVNANRGVLVTPIGYSEMTYNRAYFDEYDLQLDIYNFKELDFLQGFGAIPYSGENGVILISPMGWVIDAKRREGMVAVSFRQGLTFEQAAIDREFMYFNFWEKDSIIKTPSELLHQQAMEIESNHPDAQSVLNTMNNSNGSVYIRETIVSSYPTPEYACAIDHGDFIFFGIMFSPLNRVKINKEKMRKTIARTMPLKIRHQVQ